MKVQYRQQLCNSPAGTNCYFKKTTFEGFNPKTDIIFEFLEADNPILNVIFQPKVVRYLITKLQYILSFTFLSISVTVNVFLSK